MFHVSIFKQFQNFEAFHYAGRAVILQRLIVLQLNVVQMILKVFHIT